MWIYKQVSVRIMTRKQIGKHICAFLSGRKLEQQQQHREMSENMVSVTNLYILMP
jgi:hypothetical protein